MKRNISLERILRFAILPAMLAGCKGPAPEPPPTLLPKYKLSSVLLVEDLKSPGFGDFPTRFDAAMVASLKACSIDVHSYVAHEQTLSLSDKDENTEAIAAKLREFKPQTLIAIESPTQTISGSVFSAGNVQHANIKVIVKDMTSNAIIRTIDLGSLGRGVSGDFGDRRGGLRWQILHRLNRDGLLACDPGPTDGDWVGFGL